MWWHQAWTIVVGELVIIAAIIAALVIGLARAHATWHRKNSGSV